MADVVVIGGGIAGVSAGCFLAEEHEVVLVEAEATLAHHTTGRSAAVFTESYGTDIARQLAVASREVAEPFMATRAVMLVGGKEDRATLELAADRSARLVPSVRLLDTDEARDICPVLRADQIVGGVLEPDAADIDVHGIHQKFVAGFRRSGGEVRTSAPVTAIERDGARWRVTAGDDEIGAEVVVDAAGAWGDRVAAMAGVDPLGLQPLRRTAFTVPAPEAYDVADWPLVIDVHERWYFKPEGPQLLCSLADETLSEPCDARPEEVDVALALDRINGATTMELRHVRRSWAGLRTFSPDREPVVGFDPDHPGFFWLVGQGGYGICTSPAMGRLTASLIGGRGVPDDLAGMGLEAAMIGPERHRSS